MAFHNARLKSATLSECFEGYNEEGKKVATTSRRFADQIADQLEGKLLLIHGLTDMFAPQSGTLRLVTAIQAANKEIDLMVMPQVGHDIPAYALRRTWDYVVTHCQTDEGLDYINQYGLAGKLDQAVHLVWTTGGCFVPEDEYQGFYQRGQGLA